MNERFKRLVRRVIPPGMLDLIVARFFRVRWTGDYASWEEAARRSQGYDAGAILKRVTASTRLARDGKVSFERDGRVFHEDAPNERLISVIRQATEGKDSLAVLDYGGALGSAYWQNRSWLPKYSRLRWCVVEQPHFASVGRTEFANDALGFCTSLEEVGRLGEFDVALLAGVLGYLPSPHALLQQIARSGIRHIFIERTAFLRTEGRDRLTVQHVPRNLYRASYPCWFFSQERLVAHFTPAYRLVGAWPEAFEIAQGVEYRVLHLRKVAS